LCKHIDTGIFFLHEHYILLREKRKALFLSKFLDIKDGFLLKTGYNNYLWNENVSVQHKKDLLRNYL